MSRTVAKMLLLGAPRIEVDGAPIEVDTRKATAILAYLALTGRRHTRDALAGLLWPEYPQRRARAALRRTLSSLSAARAGGWLEVGRENIGLDPEKTWVDVDRFRELVAEYRAEHGEGDVCARCLEPLEEAVALYRDDFLAGFALRDSAAFDDWQFFESEELRRDLAGALERLSRVLAARAEWEKAISHARRWLSLDGLHEPAHRWLMLLYAWAGERTGALRQYRECVRVLEAELGVSPLEETTRLYESIREDDPPPPPEVSEGATGVAPRAEGVEVSPAPPGVPPRGEASGRGAHHEPLVGRRSEWETLLRAYDAAEGSGRLVIIEGEAGVGKTRLAEALVERASAGGAVVLAARCYPGESSLAYGPFVECLSAATRRKDLTARLAGLPGHLLVEAARLAPALAGVRPGLPPPPPLEDPGAQSRFFEGICQALVAICDGPSAGVLFIDDVHWADSSSVDLLAYLTRRGRAQKKPCILLTWRNEEVAPDDRLRGLLKEAQRAHAATLVRLGRLDRAAVEELVAAVMGEAPNTLGGRLYQETEGLPLFLGEYLAAIASGDLDAEDEAWSLPGGVRDLLAGRLETVGESARQLLGAAATIGRSFDFDTLREASGRGEEETIAALEELVEGGLIQEVGEERERSPAYDFSHEKLRALAYEEISLARRRLLHRRVAETLERRAHRRRGVGPAAAQIARHYQLAGRDAEAGRYFEIAGEHARGLYANVEALSHFRAALALGHPDVAALHEAIGDLHTLLGEYGEALSSYEAAGAFGANLAGIERKLGEVYGRLGERELAERHLEAALSSAPGASADERARTYAELGLVAHHRGQPDLALERARRALEEASGDERALAQVHNVLGVLASGRGDLEEARHHLERSLRLAEALEDPVARVAALNNLALALGGGGDLEGALERARTALSLCISLGDRHREAALHNNLADLLHAAGSQEESMEHLKRAVEIFSEIGEGGELRPEIWKLVEW